jgi:hypothetical protein
MTYESAWQEGVTQQMGELKRAESQRQAADAIRAGGYLSQRAAEQLPAPPLVRGALKYGGMAAGAAAQTMKDNAIIDERHAEERLNQLESAKPR